MAESQTTIARADDPNGAARSDLDWCLRDNSQAWELKPDGRYERIGRGRDSSVNAQAELLAAYAAGPVTATIPEMPVSERQL